MNGAKQLWRSNYRLLRIIRRESGNASMDLFVYGSSVVRIRPDGEAEHIPFAEVTILPTKNIIAPRLRTEDFPFAPI